MQFGQKFFQVKFDEHTNTKLFLDIWLEMEPDLYSGSIRKYSGFYPG